MIFEFEHKGYTFYVLETREFGIARGDESLKAGIVNLNTANGRITFEEWLATTKECFITGIDKVLGTEEAK